MSKSYYNLAGGSFTQNWSNSGLITINDNWSGVPSIEGFLGDISGASPPLDPRTLTDANLGTLHVLANQTNPNTTTAGDVAEFDGIADRTIALQASGTAAAPSLVIYLDATNRQDIHVQFNARDIDGSTDNAVQPLNVQYRIGESGSWTNVSGGYFPDVTSGPSIATLVTHVDFTLPADANNQSQLQVRIMTANATGNDEWVGIDDIDVSSAPLTTARAINDFNGDGKSDILWQHDNGTVGIWLMNGTNILSAGNPGTNPGPAWHEIGSGDLNGDGKADILWQHNDGTVGAWLMNGAGILSQPILGTNPGPAWHLIGAGDFNGDGRDDLLWQHDDGTVGAWLMNGGNVLSASVLGTNPGSAWKAIGAGDFNGDGKADILWQHNNGTAGIWLMNGTNVLSTGTPGSNPGTAWHIIGAGDFNGDNKADILWQHNDSTVGIWLLDGTGVLATGVVGVSPGTTWNVTGAIDINGDSKDDILFQNDNGAPGVWTMDGFTVTSTAQLGENPGQAWNVIPQHELLP